MKWFNPKSVSIGKDVKKIIFKEDKVIKYFKNKESYDLTLNFYNKYISFLNYLPKINSFDDSELKIDMANCGDLLSIHNLPTNWEKIIDDITKKFIDKNIFILDLRFLPFTPYVINNICLKNDKFFLVDVALYRSRPTWYIQSKMLILKYQIKLYKKLSSFLPILIIIHIFMEIIRMLTDLVIDGFIFNDVGLIYEIKNLFRK
ncbi:hypothetical protein CPAV1605_760 [seawater metagenome]|uniref:Uncharacterized protein n=1 Tax=seawater metagenome TaxID=1561972 RepID=A0A5E8CLL4_9ZZZZ